MSNSKNDNNRTKHEEEYAELEDQLKRARADYANLEKRVEREKESFVKYANEGLLLQITQILNGLEMSVRELNNLLEYNGFTKEPITVGDTFDPNYMDAIDKEEDGNVVVDVFAPAYKLHDKYVQPAKVRVGKKSKKK